MFDSVNMHMPGVVGIVVALLAILFAGFLIAIRIVGARHQESGSADEAPDRGPTPEP